MLHAKLCVVCGQINSFYDESIVVDPQNDAIVRDLLQKLYHFKKYGGEAPSIGNVSPRQEVPEVIKPVAAAPRSPNESPQRPSESQVNLKKEEDRGEYAILSEIETSGGPQQPIEPTVDRDSIDKEEGKFEQCWRCWKCARIYKMNEQCRRCKVQIEDYSGRELDNYLELV